jgi:imidazoleglycerol-phosphate dehydratase
MSRIGKFARRTKETDISVTLELDSVRESVIATGVPFFDHMLNSFARHGRMNLDLTCKGDYHIDDHHSVEDTGICLGAALKEALGDKAGITRFGTASVPMDDSLCHVSIDISGRPYFKYTGDPLKGYIGAYNEELTLEFLYALSLNAGINLHVVLDYGENRHHIHESIFKSFAFAFYSAARIDSILKGEIPSTKGVLK